MPEFHFDAIIVGAGPAGSTVAKVIAKNGYRVLVLEEHPQIGFPQHCTGKISTNAVKELDLPKKGILQEVRGAIFYSPDMNALNIKRKDSQAYIFNRAVLDQQLASAAIRSGARLLKSARAVDIKIDPHAASVIYKRSGKIHRLSARVIIGADGSSSLVARYSGLYPRRSSTMKIAIQRDITNVRGVQSEFVEAFLGRKLAPGFFVWIVPTGIKSVKVGLSVDHTYGRDLLKYLESFIKRHPLVKERFEGSVTSTQVAHIIPESGGIRETVSNGILLVGDAAGQIKSTTGGGIYYGVLCAKIAGQVVSEALSMGADVLQRSVLMKYQTSWQKRLGNEIQMSAKIRKLLDSLTDEELNYCFQVISKNNALINLIQTKGDIDQQSELAAPLFKHMIGAIIRKPRLLKKIGKILIS